MLLNRILSYYANRSPYVLNNSPVIEADEFQRWGTGTVQLRFHQTASQDTEQPFGYVDEILHCYVFVEVSDNNAKLYTQTKNVMTTLIEQGGWPISEPEEIIDVPPNWVGMYVRYKDRIRG